MSELFLNIIGLGFVIGLILFIIRFHKNHQVIDEIPIEEIKMKVKNNLSKPPSGDFESPTPNKKQKTTQTKKIRDPVYILTPEMINDSRFEFLGISKRHGYPIYCIDSSNVNILKNIKYREIINPQNDL